MDDKLKRIIILVAKIIIYTIRFLGIVIARMNSISIAIPLKRSNMPAVSQVIPMVM